MKRTIAQSMEDIAYNAFMRAKDTNDEDGGPTDWFNDTRPRVLKWIDDTIREHNLAETKTQPQR